MVTTYGLSVGIGGLFLSALPQISCPYGYSRTLSTVVCNSITVVVGMLASYVASLMNDTYKKGVATLRVLIIITVIGYNALGFYIVYGPKNDALVLFVVVFYALGIAMIPLSMELALECVYPIGQALISGMQMLAVLVWQLLGAALFYSFARDITDTDTISGNTCNIEVGDENNFPQSYGLSLAIVCPMSTAVYLLVLIWVKVPFLRRQIDLGK